MTGWTAHFSQREGSCCTNAGGRGVLRASRWTAWALASTVGLPQQGLAQSPTPQEAPGGPPAARERPTGNTLPTISISTKRAKPRAQPIVAAGAPRTTSAALFAPSSAPPHGAAAPTTAPPLAPPLTVTR